MEVNGMDENDSNQMDEDGWTCIVVDNKLASLVATLVRNYDPACDSLTRVKSRATSISSKNIIQWKA